MRIAKPSADSEPERPTVQMAVSAFIVDGKDRGNTEATLSKKQVVFEKSHYDFVLKRNSVLVGVGDHLKT